MFLNIISAFTFFLYFFFLKVEIAIIEINEPKFTPIVLNHIKNVNMYLRRGTLSKKQFKLKVTLRLPAKL